VTRSGRGWPFSDTRDRQRLMDEGVGPVLTLEGPVDYDGSLEMLYRNRHAKGRRGPGIFMQSNFVHPVRWGAHVVDRKLPERG